MAVLESGEVFGWGYNGNGQLGLGNNVNQVECPYSVQTTNNTNTIIAKNILLIAKNIFHHKNSIVYHYFFLLMLNA
jgi:alpha-tubulin suppressor-like RCC1 family protein